MCDHHGGFGEISIDRRVFLRRGAAAGTIAVAVPMGLFGGAARAAATFKGTHGTGFCNSAFFITHAKQLGKEYGLTLEFINTPTSAEMVTFFGAGMVDVSVLPYTSFISLYDKEAPVKIVGGGGIEGLGIIAQPGLDGAEKLKGKTLGTFQMDTLEVLPYDWLKKNGVKFNEITARYMANTPEAVEAFKAKAIDFICTIQPYAAGLLNDVKGSVLLSDDINMPGMDGLHLLGEIKQRFPQLAVMIVTAYGDDKRRRRAIELGASEFLTKPVDFDRLKEQLRPTRQPTERGEGAAHRTGVSW